MQPKPASDKPCAELKYFIYVRKSTDDKSRQIRSIEDQIAEAKKLAVKHKLQVVGIIEERKSAKMPGRPKFLEMMQRIELGEAQGIISWAPDRLTRNHWDAGWIGHLVSIKVIKDLRFSNVSFEATAIGKFMLGISFAQSVFFSDNLGENITRGKRNKIENGIWPQAAPLGYRNEKKGATVEIDPVSGPLVKRLFELYATGDYSMRDVREEVVRAGLRGPRGKPPSMSKVQNALLNPFYYGVMRYGGGFYAGKHEPLITEELFDRCRRIMNGRARAKSRGFKPFMYRGLVHCGECGGTITMEIQKGHRYLRCSKRKGPCSQKYLREEDFRTLVRRAIREVSMDLVLADEILRELRLMSERDALLAMDEIARLQHEIVAAGDRRDMIWKAYYGRVISVEELRNRLSNLTVEEHSLEEKAAALEKAAGGWFEPVSKFVNASFEASCIADRNDPAETWKFFKFVGSNPTLRNGQLQWAPRGAWKLLVDEEVADQARNALEDGCAVTVAETRPDRIKRCEIPDRAMLLRRKSGLSAGGFVGPRRRVTFVSLDATRT